jgi:hypothetical protein
MTYIDLTIFCGDLRDIEDFINNNDWYFNWLIKEEYVVCGC